MLSTLSRRLRGKDEGFTLIELMVVVLIIAILIAIAIPTFLGARRRSQDRAAQSDLRNALTAEKTHYTDAEVFTAVVADGEAIEPSLDWMNGAPVNARDVDVSVSAAGDVVCLRSLSSSGKGFALGEVSTGANAGTYYTQNANGNVAIAACDAATVSAWGTKWT